MMEIKITAEYLDEIFFNLDAAEAVLEGEGSSAEGMFVWLNTREGHPYWDSFFCRGADDEDGLEIIKLLVDSAHELGWME